jgi:drug/metabolite transporter (DMT)-like permease
VTCYLLWNEVMKKLGPVTSNNYIYAQPLVTMVAAYFLLGEQIFMLGYIGCILIVGGLIISDKIKK